LKILNPVFFTAGSSSVTHPVSTAFIPSFAKVPEEVCQHIQSRFGHISGG
jgi:hypothetical protein